MTGQGPQWPIERRTMSAHLVAEAAAYPGGWVHEIDASIVSNPDGYVPVEAIPGGFAAGPDGRPAGEYARNRGHGQVHDDFTRLQTPDHWPGWLPGTPALAVRGQLQAILAARVPGSEPGWVKIIGEPAFLTTGSSRRPSPRP